MTPNIRTALFSAAFVLLSSVQCAYAADALKVMVKGITVPVEVAADNASREKGLMFRKHLPENSGMLFVMDRNDAVCMLISLKYANGLRNGANSDTHRCKQLTEHGEERCIKLREVAGFSAVRTIFQIVGPRKILHCLLGK